MRESFKGKIVEWNQQKGFGFIHPNIGSENIFIHISDFQDKNYRPTIGDVVLYKIGQGRDNKKKAIDAYIETNNNVAKNRNIFSKKRIFLLLFLGAVIMYSNFSKENIVPVVSNKFIENDIQKEENYIQDKDFIEDKEFNEFIKNQDKFIEEHTIKQNIKKPIEEHIVKQSIRRPIKKPSIKKSTSKNKYTCDGRQHCSQMKSCDEAKYFINHCPNTKMDGDNDGVPCERQLCGY